MGSSAKYFHEVVRIAERIEQAIKMGKIGGLVMDSRTMMKDESEDGSQLGKFSCTSGLVVNQHLKCLCQISTYLSHSSLCTSIY